MEQELQNWIMWNELLLIGESEQKRQQQYSKIKQQEWEANLEGKEAVRDWSIDRKGEAYVEIWNSKKL